MEEKHVLKIAGELNITTKQVVAVAGLLAENATVPFIARYRKEATGSLDDESSLYYYRARYYSSSLGRFLQTDPIGYDDGMNMYAYCGNNPVNFVDPLGLCKEDPLYERAWDAWSDLIQEKFGQEVNLEKMHWMDKWGEGYYYGTECSSQAIVGPLEMLFKSKKQAFICPSILFAFYDSNSCFGRHLVFGTQNPY